MVLIICARLGREMTPTTRAAILPFRSMITVDGMPLGGSSVNFTSWVPAGS